VGKRGGKGMDWCDFCLVLFVELYVIILFLIIKLFHLLEH
jgi:hypothetical protein